VSGTCYIKVTRQLCSPCTNDLQCPDGGGCFTVPGSGERYCTGPCGASDSCPPSYACLSVGFFTTGVEVDKKQCVPANAAGTCEAGKTICSPCKGDDECGGYADLCVRNVVSGEQFCGVICDPARDPTDCPKGFACLDLSGQGQGPYQCVPNSGTCKGYCDSADEHVQVEQCGLGRQCNLLDQVCAGASDGRECAPCSTDDDCRKPGHETNECVVNACDSCPAKSETFCAEPCPCAETDCADGSRQCLGRFGQGFACTKVGSGAFCVPQRGTCLSGLGQLGDSCSVNGAADCVTGVCLSYGKTALCSAVCGKDTDCNNTRYQCCDQSGGFYDCSAGKRNATLDGPASGTGVCAPNGGLFGDDCRPGRPPCQSGTCLDIGTAQLCTTPCGTGDVCPTDFICRDAFLADDPTATTPVRICFPDGGGAPGSDCSFGPAACSDRLCIKKDSGPVCTKTCDPSQPDDPASACPSADWTCTAKVKPVGQTNEIQLCLPPGVTVSTD